MIHINQPGDRTGTFIADLIEAPHSPPVHHRIVVLRDWIIDQRSQGKVSLLALLFQEFGFIYWWKFTTHIHIEILDVALDNDPSWQWQQHHSWKKFYQRKNLMSEEPGLVRWNDFTEADCNKFELKL